MATKWKAKGCSVLIDISSVYTAIPSLEDFSVDGEEAETFEVKTLDQTRYWERVGNGYSAPPSIAVNYFYDPTNAVHTLMETLKGTGATTNVKTTYSDSGPLSVIYSCTGFAGTKSGAAGDGIKASYTFSTSGAPT